MLQLTGCHILSSEQSDSMITCEQALGFLCACEVPVLSSETAHVECMVWQGICRLRPSMVG